MKIIELYEKLDRLFPSSLSCDWDNDGLMCCPDANAEIRKIVYSLDCTEDTVDFAASVGANLIITHHPLIFRPLSSVVSPLIIRHVREGISVMSFHTRLDAVLVNKALAEKLGMNVVSEGFFENMGIICEENEISPDCLAKRIRERLGSDVVFVAKGSPVCRRVALLGGDGGDALRAALDSGCDTFVSGSVGYNKMLDYSAEGLTVITAGHYYTEAPVLEKMSAMVREICDAPHEFFDCNRIKCL